MMNELSTRQCKALNWCGRICLPTTNSATDCALLLYITPLVGALRGHVAELGCRHRCGPDKGMDGYGASLTTCAQPGAFSKEARARNCLGKVTLVCGQNSKEAMELMRHYMA